MKYILGSMLLLLASGCNSQTLNAPKDITPNELKLVEQCKTLLTERLPVNTKIYTVKFERESRHKFSIDVNLDSKQATAAGICFGKTSITELSILAGDYQPYTLEEGKWIRL